MDEKRTQPDRRASGRRLDERRKYGYGEVIPERRVAPRREGSRREGSRRENAARKNQKPK
jgi:hypothetical protein